MTSVHGEMNIFNQDRPYKYGIFSYLLDASC